MRENGACFYSVSFLISSYCLTPAARLGWAHAAGMYVVVYFLIHLEACDYCFSHVFSSETEWQCGFTLHSCWVTDVSLPHAQVNGLGPHFFEDARPPKPLLGFVLNVFLSVSKLWACSTVDAALHTLKTKHFLSSEPAFFHNCKLLIFTDYRHNNVMNFAGPTLTKMSAYNVLSLCSRYTITNFLELCLKSSSYLWNVCHQGCI